MFENYPDVVTVKELCQMLKIGRNTAYELVKYDRIYSVMVGKKYIIPKQSVINYLCSPCDCGIIKEHSRLVILKEDRSQ